MIKGSKHKTSTINILKTKSIGRVPPSQSGKKYPYKPRKPHFRPKFTSERLKNLRKPHYKARGENHYLWKGGKSSPNEVSRKSFEYRLWRSSVFERDNFTCVWCGQKGGNLNADHIKPFALFPELRFAIDNGRTLCVPCHKTTDTFGNKTKSK